MPEEVKQSEDVIAPEDLKEPVRKLLFLLDDPQPGMFTWWDFLNDRMIEVHGLLDRALKKSGIIK